MKLNWGNGIVVAFVLFCTFIVAIVVKSFQYDVNLVSDDYYQQELQYQEVIDAKANGAELKGEASINYDGEKITVKVPTENVNGTIHFYRPDDNKLDQKLPLTTSEYSVSDELLKHGRYVAKVTWKDSNKNYFMEQDLFVR